MFGLSIFKKYKIMNKVYNVVEKNGEIHTFHHLENAKTLHSKIKDSKLVVSYFEDDLRVSRQD